MNIIFVGIDLIKNVFVVHGVNEAGKPAVVKLCVAIGSLLNYQPSGGNMVQKVTGQDCC